MSKRVRMAVAGIVVLLALAAVSSGYAQEPAPDASAQIASADVTLSPYWDAKVQRWSTLIVQAAARRHLDPDFLASLIWKESRGDSQAIGPLGSVGLMQVMPQETGFGWRPTQAVLLDPYTNLFWGSRTLATVIQQGEGDIFHALAAYNGGWDKVDLGVPRQFAATILRDYANAVAARYALAGDWVAFFAVRNADIRGPVWVADARRADVYFFGDENWIPEGSRLIPDVPPASVVSTYLDAVTWQTYQVGIWLYDGVSKRWVTGDPVGTSLVPLPTPTATPLPTATPVRPRATPTIESTATPVSATVVATATVEIAPCPGGKLEADAWFFDRHLLETGGWEATVYVNGRGGACVYTYAWNEPDNIVGGPIAGCITFKMQQTDRNGNIIGNVLVTSGEETIKVGVFIAPPP